ncbi:hypothetical protein KO533_02075 [Shewanella sp. NKUCC05_KAH]|jgi:hypothetical protein|uniref:Uncharacterized protein n=1 Tax=Shewanella oncorhynchi TaxID=2726434 RepID=A0ABX1KK32_9GAMM|nr:MULTISPECIES: hypothetical protein [Shewanella]RBP80778.1 hypothetical protein DET47_10466 [Shewanella putrefaciens]AVI67642.1 hypothetical protein CKQ84_18240 [Shewanella sp. WE21]MBI1674696.1 hypothetical protein [Shewanella sp. DW31]MBS0041718.1 hypothetical protein [Shewanella sp. M16]MBW3513408.1 hypothetical protein [Shewanella sp. NKUCC01_JLK]
MRHALYQLQQENRLSCQLARELVSLIETVPYQQNTLELKFLELLACTQQKNRSLILLMQIIESVDIESQRQRQYQFSQRLSLLICDWQQHREMNKLNQQFIPLLRHYLIESQALEQDFYQQIQQQIIATSALPDHNRRAQNQN